MNDRQFETGERVRRMRIALGLTAEALCEKAKISRVSLNNVERGYVTEKYERHLEKIAYAMKLPDCYFKEPLSEVTGLEQWSNYLLAQEFEKRFMR